MLTFTRYVEDRDDTDRQVQIDPLAVASVIETERHPRNAVRHQVAVITLATGGKHVVEDGDRTAARLIRQAKEAARDRAR